MGATWNRQSTIFVDKFNKYIYALYMLFVDWWNTLTQLRCLVLGKCMSNWNLNLFASITCSQPSMFDSWWDPHLYVLNNVHVYIIRFFIIWYRLARFKKDACLPIKLSENIWWSAQVLTFKSWIVTQFTRLQMHAQDWQRGTRIRLQNTSLWWCQLSLKCTKPVKLDEKLTSFSF